MLKRRSTRTSPEEWKPQAPSVAPLVVAALSDSATEAARALAQNLGVTQLATGINPKKLSEGTLVLLMGDDTLALQQTGAAAPGPVSVDFGSGGMRHRRRGGNNELLGKALGVGKVPLLTVLDATAGLGRDSFVLADLGCKVHLCERSRVVAQLLRVGIQRGNDCADDWLAGVTRRMQLWPMDARELPATALDSVDVIYLDPMFPGRDKSAAVKKEMVLLQSLLGSPDDADALLDWALRQDVARIVVKRPSRALALGGRPPSHCISGKSVRYDVHVLRGLG